MKQLESSVDAGSEARRRVASAMERLESSGEGEAAAAEAERTQDAGVRGRATSAAAKSSVDKAVPVGVATGSFLDAEPLRMAPVAPTGVGSGARQPARDADLLPCGGTKGPARLAKRTDKAYSEQRRASIRRCLDGECGRRHVG
eukprot:3209605-Prymnesium_polylepis.1